MENEKIWDILLDAVNQHRVVPIIGDEFYYAQVDNELINYKQFILDQLVSKFIPPKDVAPDFNMIADLIKISNQMKSAIGAFANTTSIYYEIDEIVRNTPVVCDPCLKDFVEAFQFPLILTTSYIPGLETVYDNSIVIKAYDKTPRMDISALDPQSTTLYYLFGKCSKANKTYMVTEDDLLDYMHFWHNNDTRPRLLSDYLQNKFLLLLGCNYPNWLFRFFWHSIKNFNLFSGYEGVKGVVASSSLNTDNELSRFLSRMQTQTYTNGKAVMEELKKKKGIGMGEDACDIFLSYSHKDYKTAAKIADTFTRFGANVWFDSKELKASDLYDKIISDKISKCKRFVPILSHTTETEERAYFRKEWSLALDEIRFRLGSPYIAPINIDDIDYNSNFIPKEFKEAHIISFHTEGFENEVKRLIRSFRQQQ